MLVDRVNIPHIRTGRNGIKIFDFSGKQAAFQSGVRDFDDRLFAVLLFVDRNHDVAQAAVFFVFPSRVVPVHGEIRAEGCGKCLQIVEHFLLFGSNAAANRYNGMENASVGLSGDIHNAEIQRALHQSRNLLAHRLHTERNTRQKSNNLVG